LGLVSLLGYVELKEVRELMDVNVFINLASGILNGQKIIIPNIRNCTEI
jgi:hypothetical protein